MKKTKCAFCGKEFLHENWQKRKYCSRDCYGKSITGKTRIFTKEWKENISKGCVGRTPWNKDMDKEDYASHYINGFGGALKGNIPWNKDLDGEEYMNHFSNGFGGAPKGQVSWCKGMHGKDYLEHFSGGRIWCDGLTKKTDERIAKYATKLEDIPKTEEHKRKVSETRKRLFKEGKLVSPMKGKKGSSNPTWKGGGFPYYGYTWERQRKKVLERANYKSELSGKRNGKNPDVHHIYNARTFLKKYLELCFTPYIPEMKINSFKYKYHRNVLIPPDTVFIKLLADELNVMSNLIALTTSEHHHLQDMPPSFFYNILSEKKKREEN